MTAIVVTNGTSAYLTDTVSAILQQETPVSRLIVVDVAAQANIFLPDQVSLAELGVERYELHGVETFGEAVGQVIEAAHVKTNWVWLFHDDCAPRSDALRELLKSLEHTQAVAVAGAKHVDWYRNDRLLEIGVTLSKSGRRMGRIDRGEMDQGQHDARQDVLATSLSGALVKTEVWQELHGTDKTYGKFGDSVDFCRRAWRAGHRVTVVPSAIVKHAQATLTGRGEIITKKTEEIPGFDISDETFGPRLRSILYDLATNISPFLMPFLLIAAVLAGPVRALYRLATKHPRAILDEIWSPIWLLGQISKIQKKRKLIRQTAKLNRGILKPLLATGKEVWSRHNDQRLKAREERRALNEPNELEKREAQKAASERRFAVGIVVFISLVITIWVMRPVLATLWNGGKLLGGGLLPQVNGAGHLWDVFTNGWVQDGLGASAPADPIIVSLIPGSLLVGSNTQLFLNLVVISSILIASLGAWFASGVITRRPGLRAASAIFWILIPTFLSAINEGRLGAIIVHLTLPWFALATCRALGIYETDPWVKTTTRKQKSSLSALGVAALLLAVITAAAPAMFLPVFLLLVLYTFFVANGGKRLIFVLPIPALILLAPIVLRAFAIGIQDGWRMIFADPGLAVGYEPAALWQMFFGIGIDPYPFGGWFETIITFLPGAILLAAAAVAIISDGGFGKGARAILWTVPFGLAYALVAAQSQIEISEGGYLTSWAGNGVSLMMLGVLTAAVIGVKALAPAQLESQKFELHKVAGGVLAAVMVINLVALGSWSANNSWQGSTRLLTQNSHEIVPAVGQQMQNSARQVRILMINATDQGQATYQLLHANGTQLADVNAVLKIAKLSDKEDPLAQLVAQVFTGAVADQGNELANYGIGAVLVPNKDALANAQLITRIDTIFGLQRITEGDFGVIWRVTRDGKESSGENVSWASLLTIDPQGNVLARQPIPAQNLSIDTEVSAAELGQGLKRVLVLAESQAPGWQATFAGESLAKTEVSGIEKLQAFEVPASAGELEVNYRRASRLPWLGLQGGVLLVYALLALPIKRRKGNYA